MQLTLWDMYVVVSGAAGRAQCVSVWWFVFSSGLLQISPVERGVVTLLGIRSGLFVAMSRRGKLYGSVSV